MEHLRCHGLPSAHDYVEISDPRSGRRVRALVESAIDLVVVLRLEQATPLSDGEAAIRWFDGAAAWQAAAHFERVDEARIRCEFPISRHWELTSARLSKRVRVGQSQLLVRIVSSSALPGGRRVHTECLEASATGCRVTWPGQTPRRGDSVDLTWDIAGRPRGMIELGWIAARVARVIPRANANEVCFRFTPAKLTQAARIRTWHQAWMQRELEGESAGG